MSETIRTLGDHKGSQFCSSILPASCVRQPTDASAPLVKAQAVITGCVQRMLETATQANTSSAASSVSAAAGMSA
jgi:hypothetical protein